jgi:hypothetical protein
LQNRARIFDSAPSYWQFHSVAFAGGSARSGLNQKGVFQDKSARPSRRQAAQTHATQACPTRARIRSKRLQSWRIAHPLRGFACNPDADSWVAEFLAWWIDQETGLPIPERAGVLRYYIRVSGKIVWADRAEDLMQYIPRPAELRVPRRRPPQSSSGFAPKRSAANCGAATLPRLSPPLLKRCRPLAGRASGHWRR